MFFVKTVAVTIYHNSNSDIFSDMIALVIFFWCRSNGSGNIISITDDIFSNGNSFWVSNSSSGDIFFDAMIVEVIIFLVHHDSSCDNFSVVIITVIMIIFLLS